MQLKPKALAFGFLCLQFYFGCDKIIFTVVDALLSNIMQQNNFLQLYMEVLSKINV